jgi:hypothetical protein
MKLLQVLSGGYKLNPLQGPPAEDSHVEMLVFVTLGLLVVSIVVIVGGYMFITSKKSANRTVENGSSV